MSSQEIINGFDAAGIDVDEILPIQQRASDNTWVVSFRSTNAKNVALGVLSVSIAGCTVFLSDCENRVMIVKIYEAPTELPDTVLIGRLSHYGKVFSFRRDRVAANIYNGVRTAKMQLNLPIPPTIFVAGGLIRIWYPSQPKMCIAAGMLDAWPQNAHRSGALIVKRRGIGLQIASHRPFALFVLRKTITFQYVLFCYIAQMWLTSLADL